MQFIWFTMSCLLGFRQSLCFGLSCVWLTVLLNVVVWRARRDGPGESIQCSQWNLLSGHRYRQQVRKVVRHPDPNTRSGLRGHFLDCLCIISWWNDSWTAGAFNILDPFWGLSCVFYLPHSTPCGRVRDAQDGFHHIICSFYIYINKLVLPGNVC